MSFNPYFEAFTRLKEGLSTRRPPCSANGPTLKYPTRLGFRRRTMSDNTFCGYAPDGVRCTAPAKWYGIIRTLYGWPEIVCDAHRDAPGFVVLGPLDENGLAEYHIRLKELMKEFDS
jgi:hypothetical protein